MIDRDGISIVPPTPAATAEEILANAIWIVEQLDTRALREISDLPVLELAKHFSLTRRAAA